jgi:hypothetical protein
MAGDERSGHSRAQRIRRWLTSCPDGIALVRVEVSRGDDGYEPLTYSVWSRERLDEVDTVAGYLSVALQDQADATCSVVHGRLAGYLDGADTCACSLSVRATPSEDADVLPDGVYDGSVAGQLGQLQQLLQAYARIGIEERLAAYRGFDRVLSAQSGLVESLLARWETESQRSDALREAIVEATAEDGGLPAWAETLVAQLPALVGVAGTALARRNAHVAAPSTPVEAEEPE